MKTINSKFLLALAAMLMSSAIFARQSATQGFWVHEDVVKPSKVADYEAICKELTDNMKKHNIQDMHAIVASTADMRYLWISPIENMATIDKPIFKTLSEKMGADKMSDLFNRMNKCYDVEHDYVIHLNKDLSYQPTGIDQTPEGQEYRKFHYFHYTPGNKDVVSAKVKEIRDMYVSKGSNLHYRVYENGFGTRGAFYMVAIAAQDEADYAAKIAANNAMMGDAWAKLYGEFRATLSKYESFEGQMRPDMAYVPTVQ
ncbi:MAG: hypothetical protein KJO73_01485 [Croceitalea sp.]|nr:hypothetical protein [Croceitalea sp.]